MQVFNNPDASTWNALCKRPQLNTNNLSPLISEVFRSVQQYGDKALLDYTLKFDGASLSTVIVSAEEIAASINKLGQKLKDAIQVAYTNIRTFHEAQRFSIPPTETSKGVVCWSENRPIEKVGLYIPGGTAPLFSTLLMLGIPATLAGCPEIVLCTPPDKEGNIDPAILYTASLIGISRIIKLGGIQAIAAMTFGTASVPAVYKLFGPGNQYVTAAKQAALNYGVAIDMPAGPSEALVIADEDADPAFVAADLLAQAEHGPDSQVMLVCTNRSIADKVLAAMIKQVECLPRKAITQQALAESKVIILPDLDTCFAFSNQYAPEHLIINVQDALRYTTLVSQAGSVFVGPYSCESAGDYASGPNHTLPTNGYARSYSGVSLNSFMRSITFQHVNRDGICNLGPVIEEMASAEQLQAHKQAVSIRLARINEQNTLKP